MPGRFSSFCQLLCCTLLSYVPRAFFALLALWTVHALISLCLRFYESNYVAKYLLIFFGTLFYILVNLTYFQAIIQGPGSPLDIPGFAVKPVADLEAANVGLIAPPSVERNVTAKENGQMRYCNKCQCWKPDRAHHCSSCGKCVLRMDHHCPWFSTCIGFNNYKFFIQFLVYMCLFSAVCFIASAHAVIATLYSLKSQDRTQLLQTPVTWVALLLLSVVYGCAISMFTGYNLYLAARNRTVLENLEAVRYKTSLPSRAFRYREAPSSKSIGNIFDLGWKRNLYQILGPSLWHWFVPFHISHPHELDGTCFPINEDMFNEAQQLALDEHELLEQQYNYRQSQRNMIRSEMVSVPDNDNIPLSSLTSASVSHTPASGFVNPGQGSSYYQQSLDSNNDDFEDDLDYYYNKGVESIPLTSARGL